LHNIHEEKCPRGTPQSRWEQQVRKNVTEEGGRMKVSETGGRGRRKSKSFGKTKR
jgi:hypothetical protein